MLSTVGTPVGGIDTPPEMPTVRATLEGRIELIEKNLVTLRWLRENLPAAMLDRPINEFPLGLY